MSENKLQFPLTVRTDGEEFIINKEDEPTSPNQFLHDFDGDRGRSKRRRRCGQCGPCQVKENCNKCNFCLRRDVLKQTCIYRKCVYLRSKPKPYPNTQTGSDFNHVTSPPSSNKNFHTSANSSNGPDISGHNNSVSETNNVNLSSPFSPINSSSGGPQFLSSESLFKPPMPHGSHTSHTPIVISSPENVPPTISPYNPQLHSVHNPVPPCGMSEKIHQMSASDNSSSSFPSPLSQPYIPNNTFKYDSYLNHYNRPPPTNDSRTNMSSPCMYHPGFSSPYGTTGPVDRGPYHGHYVRPPTIPPYLPTNTNMLRHFTSLPQRYPIPQAPRRYGECDGPLPGYGFQPPDMQMTIPGMSHHHPFNSYSNINRHQPQYEQSTSCPKNVFGPPAFPSLALGTLRVQERPLGIHNFRCNPFMRPLPWEKHYFHPIQKAISDSSDDAKSSGYECDVISVDDIEMNAYIRSDGCNSIEIELEEPKSPSDKKETKQRWFREPDINSNYKNEQSPPRKITLTGFVTLKQDLGDEGIVQLDIPGHKVTLEESFLDFSLAKYSCNITDLLKFIESEPRNELESQNEISCQ